MMTTAKAIDKLEATIKRTSNGKLVAEVKCDDCRYYGDGYKGKLVTINDVDCKVIDAGKVFGNHGDTRMYLYLDESCDTPATSQPANAVHAVAGAENKPCRRCGTYCYGDCTAN